MRFLLWVPIWLGAVTYPFHEAHYKAGWDIDWSPYSGGENILFATRGLEWFEGMVLPLSPEYYFSKSASFRFGRLCELFFVWAPMNELAVTAQHEIFGHGYRLRTLNHTHVRGYKFKTPFPYGNGGGSTKYSVSNSFTTTEESCVAMAGVESTAILAQLTKLKWLEAKRIDPRQAVLYLLAENDLNLYIGTLKSKLGNASGHDIKEYIQALNHTYTSHSISSARLRSLSWINLADPFIFYSIYAWFHYIGSGKETKIPMIRIGPGGRIGYLPNLRLGLTPFGPEVFLENYFLDGKKPFYVYLTGGHHSGNTYGGGGFFVPHIYNIRKWSLGARLDTWFQPKLLLYAPVPFQDIDLTTKTNKKHPLYSYSAQSTKSLGLSGSAILAWQSHNRSGLEVELGYKSQGFLPGYALSASPVVRLYFSLLF